MIIDSKKYNGACSCGKEHKMTTELCIIESGCLRNVDKYISDAGLCGVSVAIYDTNTYAATEDRRPSADYEIVLDAEGLHADDHAVALIDERLPEKFDYLIAVGSGTVHDATRYCAYTHGVDFVSCPTAASVDGFCSSVAAMTWHGFKKTLTAVSPKIVVADLDIIKNAPMRLSRSGFCDMIGKFIALSDWRIGHILTGESLCERIYGMTMDATRAVVECAAGIRDRLPEAYEKLTYGLLMSGLAMQLLGNSRCASGAEHHISHIIEMQPEGLGVSSSALHGEKVGVGTMLASAEYHRLRDCESLAFGDYATASEEYIRAMFGERLSDSVMEENKKDAAEGITAAAVREKWEEICRVIDGIPTPDELSETYATVGAMSTLTEIGVPEELAPTLFEYSPLVRNRLTLMRLRRALA